MTQKIIQVGNSAAVTIPKDFFDLFNLKIGDSIDIQKDMKGGSIHLSVKNASGRLSVTPEFHSWLEGIEKKYGNVIKELAKR